MILTLPITSFSTDIHALAAIRSLENLAAEFQDMFAAISSYIHTCHYHAWQ